MPLDIIPNLWKRIPKTIKITFFATFLICLLVHMFMFTNKLPNQDDIATTLSNMDYSAFGRWFMAVPGFFSSIYSMPWVNGVLSSVYIALSACFIVVCFGMKSTFLCVLCGAVLATFPVVGSIFTYMSHADAFFFGLMLACFACYLLGRFKYGFLYGIIPLVLALGCYQSYIGFAAAVAVCMLIFAILTGSASARKNVLQGVRSLVFLAVSVVAYTVIVYLFEPNGLGRSELNPSLDFAALPELFIRALAYVFQYYFLNARGFHYGFGIAYIALVLAVTALIIFVVKKRKLYQSKANLALLMVLCMLLLLSCNLIYVASGGFFHLVMMGGLCAPLIAALKFTELIDPSWLAQRKSKLFAAIMSWIIIAVLSMSCFMYGIATNKAYFSLWQTYELGYAYSNRLIARIESTEGYHSGMPVYLIGTPQDSPDSFAISDAGLSDFTGATPNIPTAYSYRNFLEFYMGLTKVNSISFSEFLVEYGEEYPDMTSKIRIYPNETATFVLEDKLFVCFNQ